MLRRSVSSLGVFSARMIAVNASFRHSAYTNASLAQARSFATTADAEIQRSQDMFSPTKFKPPAQVYGTSGRYASACWSVAAKEKKLEKIETELADLKKLFEEKPDFLASLSDPTELRHVKIKNVQEIFTKGGVDRILRNLFVVMAENGRMGLIPKVIADYNKLMSAHRKETIVKITTASKLTKPELEILVAQLNQKIGADRKITMELHVEPEIIGGLIVEWDDAYRMDLSISSSVKRLEAELMSAL